MSYPRLRNHVSPTISIAIPGVDLFKRGRSHRMPTTTFPQKGEYSHDISEGYGQCRPVTSRRTGSAPLEPLCSAAAHRACPTRVEASNKRRAGLAHTAHSPGDGYLFFWKAAESQPRTFIDASADPP